MNKTYRRQIIPISYLCDNNHNQINDQKDQRKMNNKLRKDWEKDNQRYQS